MVEKKGESVLAIPYRAALEIRGNEKAHHTCGQKYPDVLSPLTPLLSKWLQKIQQNTNQMDEW